MKKIIITLSLLAILPLSAFSQFAPTHHLDICGTVELAPDNIGRYFQTDLGYKYSFIQEIAFPVGTRLHLIGTVMDSCDIHEGISQCIHFEEISECDCPAQYGTCCVGITGDINGDGAEITDITDLLYLVDYMFSLDPPVPPCLDEADFVQDGQIDISDLIRMVDIIFIFPSVYQLPPCPVDTVRYVGTSDYSQEPFVFEFYFKPENQLYVKGTYGFDYEGFYSGNSMMFYNWDVIDAQSVLSCTECGDTISCYSEIYTIAGPRYEKMIFIKQQ